MDPTFVLVAPPWLIQHDKSTMTKTLESHAPLARHPLPQQDGLVLGRFTVPTTQAGANLGGGAIVVHTTKSRRSVKHVRFLSHRACIKT